MKIEPKLSVQQRLCVEVVAPPCGIVVFGASGDLTRRKLIVSLFHLFADGLMTEQFYILGCGRSQISDSEFRKIARESIEQSIENPDGKKLELFLDHCYFASGGYDQTQLYETIRARTLELDQRHGIRNSWVYYLSVPPTVYVPIVQGLGKAGLSKGPEGFETAPRILIEKPFGRDLQSARELNDEIAAWFHESQVYRIDHYLGKETVQNLLMFRFANAIFEPIWNRNYIDHVQIAIAESLGVEHRAGYYDKSGAIRDMFQNHMLNMLALVAMEPPSAFEADAIRDEKVKLLRAIRPFDLEPWSTDILRGQYIEGEMDGKKVPGYRQEEDVAKDSTTETFVAARLFIDNWRWRKVPFYLRTGKRLAKKVTEIAIQFRHVPHSMFEPYGIGDLPPNVLVMKIQPEEGISLSFQAKSPGAKACITTLTMSFSYAQLFGQKQPEAYQRLLLDCMVGDQTLFNRQDDVEVSWKLINPILDAWESDGGSLYEYPAGSDSFSACDELIESDGRNWRRLSEI